MSLIRHTRTPIENHILCTVLHTTPQPHGLMRRCTRGIHMDLCARFSQQGVAIQVDLALWWLMVFTVVDGLRIATIVKKSSSELLFFFAILDKNQRQIIDFETAKRVAKRWWRLASSDHDPHRRFGLPNGALDGPHEIETLCERSWGFHGE
jgi:hypothetical protein